MDCPNCGYFIDVEQKNYTFQCLYCKSTLSYNLNKDKLTVVKKYTESKKEQNFSVGTLTSKICTQCGATIPIYNPGQSHGFSCPQCHSHLYWDASSKDIEANTKKAEMAHKEKIQKLKIKQNTIRNDYELEKIKIEHEQKRKDNIQELIISYIPIALSLIIMIILILLLKDLME